MTTADYQDIRDPAAALRPPDQVMRLERMGSFFATPISFMRTLVRRMSTEKWTFERERMELDENGFGRLVDVVGTPHGEFSFVAFSHRLEPEERTDRVIAERWDATFALCEGRLSDAELDRLEANVPLQERGRCSAGELVLSRANKSVRLFEYVADRLAAGEQPDALELMRIGYLMRTTAVYGNGKFGLCDFPKLFGQDVFNAPFQAEMLTVYMIRNFSFDLVEHVARARNPQGAVPFDATRKRLLGIGNATGLGMAPFLIKHPILIHHWLCARETALARVRATARPDADRKARFIALLDRAIRHVGEWNVEDDRQQARIVTLRRELDDLRSGIEGSGALDDERPWNRLYEDAEARWSLEGQEMMVSLLLETNADRITDLEHTLATGDIEATAPAMQLSELKEIVERNYQWALEIDFSDPLSEHYFWYYSEEKDEPRRGPRHEEPGAECEMRLGFGREVNALYSELTKLDDDGLSMLTSEFLMRHPRWRAVVRRVQTLARYPYGEIRNNLLGPDCLPIDMLRCKLSFFGATKFDPKSDLWTRITMYQGAPLIEELDDPDVDDWAFPVSGEA